MDAMFHIYSKGENVLFRNNSDYIYFHNKFAIASARLKLKVLAFTTMSTHFHTIVEAADADDIAYFQSKLKKVYGIYYNHKYKYSLGNNFKISNNTIEDFNELKTKALYVLRNPTHHYVSRLPLKYKYCSAYSLFADEITSEFLMQQNNSLYKIPADLKYRERRAIFGRDLVPNKCMINTNGMITFDSFVKTKRARALWDGNVKKFLYDMNSSVTDATASLIDWDTLDLRTSSMSDIDVCQMIDLYSKSIGVDSFHYLDNEHKENLVENLKKRMVLPNQIARCLWL